MKTIKERPILFSGKMVCAILDGRKTQTRRIVKLPVIDKDYGCELSGGNLASSQRDIIRHSPYGQPGDQLWVKETHRVNGAMAGPRITYRADGAEAFPQGCPDTCKDWCADDNNWRPSIFMRRYTSRIQLVITSVRVERLNDIIEEDALAEGIKEGCGEFDYYVPRETGMALGDVQENPSCAYQRLWKSINGAGSWAENPWVWVIQFERIKT